MMIYNVTTKVDIKVANEWLSWLKEEHIPDMVSTGCFTHAVILKIADVDDTEGPTYAVQYHADNNELYDQYINKFSGLMRKKTIDKWGNNFISFRTRMTVVN